MNIRKLQFYVYASVSDLLRNETLEILDVSACGIEEAGGIALAEVLSSGSMKCKRFSLYVSNNDFGEAGKIILLTKKFKQNITLL